MKDLRDKTAVITGAGSGIGRALAIACAQEGMNVVVADIEEDTGKQAASEAAELGVRSLFVPTDVADLTSMVSLADASYAEFGAVHLLCNNVAVIDKGSLMVEMPVEDWQWLISVNLWGVIHGLLAFVPRMRQQAGEKHIMNTGSTASYVPVPGLGPYSATKFAVAALTEALRAELASEGIGVSIFNPAHTSTNLAATSERSRRRFPGREQQPPPELAKALTQRNSALEPAIDPLDAARIALRGVQENAEFIFTPTPTRVAIARQRFERILAAYPPYPTPEGDAP
jgi:NAD(P)-dependent dehydrogenase (short-subunit alcohol dehydrogenase family)